MASFDFTMVRYYLDTSIPLRSALIKCAGDFHDNPKFGLRPPTIAHISVLAKGDAPSAIGVMRVERVTGLYPFEVDLGPVPERITP